LTYCFVTRTLIRAARRSSGPRGGASGHGAITGGPAVVVTQERLMFESLSRLMCPDSFQQDCTRGVEISKAGFQAQKKTGTELRVQDRDRAGATTRVTGASRRAEGDRRSAAGRAFVRRDRQPESHSGVGETLVCKKSCLTFALAMREKLLDISLRY